MNVCKVYLLTGNCPTRDSCKQTHPEPSADNTEKPKRKAIGLKLGGEFKPKNLPAANEETKSDSKEQPQSEWSQKAANDNVGGTNNILKDEKKNNEQIDTIQNVEANSKKDETGEEKKRGKLKLTTEQFEVNDKNGKANLKAFLIAEKQKEDQKYRNLYSNDDEEEDEEEDEEDEMDEFYHNDVEEVPGAAYWNCGDNNLVLTDRDPMFYYEKSQGCSCCKGHIYNCQGEICQNLDACYCYELDEEETN